MDSSSIDSFLEGIQDVLKSLDMHQMNDERTMFIIVFLISIISLFVLYALKNFYRLGPDEYEPGSIKKAAMSNQDIKKD